MMNIQCNSKNDHISKFPAVNFNIGVLSKLLGHSSIQITLDSYATVIDELMIKNVRDLKEKLSDKKQMDDGKRLK